jgi:ATP-binding protein involved in chromosome partitioning
MAVTEVEIVEALRPVEDPELHRSIVDLDMVRSVAIEGESVMVEVALTVAGCPLRNEITRRVTERGRGTRRGRALRHRLHRHDRRRARRAAPEAARRPRCLAGSHQGHGHAEGRAIPFADPASRTRCLLIASGKGGVGKSSVTTNLAIALAQRGKVGRHRRRRRVGLLDPEDARRRPPAHGHRLDARAAGGPRGAVHLDGLLRRGGPARHLAWPDAAQGARAVPHRRLLGRPRLPRHRPPAGHRRHLAVARPVPAPRRGLRRHHPPAGRPARRPAGRVHGPEGAARREGRHREHVVVHRRRRHALRAVRAGGGAELANRLGVPLIGQVPLVPQLREGSDSGHPLVAEDPDSEAGRIFATMAETIEVALAPTRRHHPELKII